MTLIASGIVVRPPTSARAHPAAPHWSLFNLVERKRPIRCLARRRRNPKGLFNQGWKDSGDANRHSDGTIAQPPLALVEVQGYVVRALAGISEILSLLDEQELAARAKDRAEGLKGLLEDLFWLEDRGYYAMALDCDKRPLRVDGSGSLFTDVRIYAFPNAGRWYDVGYLLGAMMFLGGAGASG